MFPLFRLLLPGLTAAFALVPPVQADPTQEEYRAALGSGDLVWTALPGAGAGEIPRVVPAAEGGEGAHLVLPKGTGLRATVTGPRLVRVIAESLDRITVDDAYFNRRFLYNVPGQPPAPWSLEVFEVPAGTWPVVFAAHSHFPARMDVVEMLARPPDVAAALGLPGAALAFGGAGEWKVVADMETAAYAAGVTLDKAHPEAWIDLPVTGPASVDFLAKAGGSGWSYYEVLLDGVPLGRRGSRVEVPAGAHVLRWRAGLLERAYSDVSERVSLAKVRVTAGREVVGRALDGGLPFLTDGDVWREEADIPGAEGGTALRRGPGAAYSSSFQIQTGFRGPGFLEYRWWLGSEGSAGFEDHWWVESGTSGTDTWSPDGPENVGWQSRRVWFPPGAQAVSWTQSFHNREEAGPALDGVRFTPTTGEVSLGEALDAPELTWRNDPLFPWIGLARDAAGDDVAVSPEPDPAGQPRVSTTVRGPGVISFQWENVGAPHGLPLDFRVGGRPAELRRGDDGSTRSSVLVPFDAPVVLEWTAPAKSEEVDRMDRYTLDQVRWAPLPKSTLASALDTAPQVKWTTSAAAPFSGRPVAGALHETAAYCAVEQGGSAWLEATVSGPGLFDFWVLDAGGPPLGGDLWHYLSVTVDGKPAVMGGSVWDPLWIHGAGTHRIRLTVRNPAGWPDREWMSLAVDEVTWRPQTTTPLAKAAGLSGAVWRTGTTNAAIGYTAGGRDGKPALLLRPAGTAGTWAETTVQGPCELAWESSLVRDDWRDGEERTLVVNGVVVEVLYSHEWRRSRLTLPAGSHRVRWVSAAAAPRASGAVDFSSIWRISGMTRTPGITPLAGALDNDTVFALETGDAGGSRISIPDGDGDAWQPGPEAMLSVFEPARAGTLTVRQGRPDSAWEPWSYYQSALAFPATTPPRTTWVSTTARLLPGSRYEWIWTPRAIPVAGEGPPLLDALAFDAAPAVVLKTAIGSAAEVTSASWVGRRATGGAPAVAGGDFAFSLAAARGEKNTMATTFTGPARVRFHWKLSGEGVLFCLLDGAPLPFSAATPEWAMAEFEAGEGTHTLEWTHAATAGASPVAPSTAGVDHLEIRAAARTPLAKAITADAAIRLAVTGPAGAGQWLTVACAEPEGTWNHAGRLTRGGRVLEATVTGPAVLDFRNRCFAPDWPVIPPQAAPAMAGTAAVSSSSVSANDSGWSDRLHIYAPFLEVSVDGAPVWRTPAGIATDWNTASVVIPGGSRKVTFRLRAHASSWITASITDALDGTAQAWVDDLKISAPDAHYAAWCAAHALSAEEAAREADADGDGTTNAAEYLFQTDPRNGAARPAAMGLALLPNSRTLGDWTTLPQAPPPPPQVVLSIPYLPALALGGWLESSTDLRTWTREPLAVKRHWTASPPFFLSVALDTDIHQKLLLTPDTTARYYRLRVE